MISWFSRKQTNMALSMTKAEYIAACLGCSEAVCIHKMLIGLFDALIDTIDVCVISVVIIRVVLS